MSVTIKNVEVEQLVGEVAGLTGESKTQAIRTALRERRDKLALRVTPAGRSRQLRRFLEREVWARIPAEQLGRPCDRAEEERILGYGDHGS